MTKKPAPKMRPDIAEIAYRTMLEATGQASKTLPPSERSKADRNPAAVARGASGGKARKAALTASQRTDIAKKGASVRWHKKPLP